MISGEQMQAIRNSAGVIGNTMRKVRFSVVIQYIILVESKHQYIFQSFLSFGTCTISFFFPNLRRHSRERKIP